MRKLLLASMALALVACAGGDDAATDTSAAATTAIAPPPGLSLSDVAGTWNGKTMAVGNDSVLTTWQLTATADTSGWSLTIGSTSGIPVRVVSVSGDSVITEAGPFPSALRPGQQVTTRAVYRLQDGKLIGATNATYANGETLTLRTEATRQ